jgi:hypothetical protein
MAADILLTGVGIATLDDIKVADVVVQDHRTFRSATG